VEGTKIVLQSTASATRPGPGRPTRAQQLQRSQELLSIALDVFLEHGFEQTTMEEIATRIGMSKRTIYAHYADKAALFKAVVRQAIQVYTVPRAALEAVATRDLEETLHALAQLRVSNVAPPVGTKLQRILSAQAYRFPELFNEAFEEGAGPTVDFLCELFKRGNASGETAISEPQRAAVAFLSLAVSGPARVIVSGNTLDEREISRRIRFAVGLFLNGARPRPAHA
jgi:TetR/AcrR family transcriptional regulator, mexJK operon transcriptional repressor